MNQLGNVFEIVFSPLLLFQKPLVIFQVFNNLHSHTRTVLPGSTDETIHGYVDIPLLVCLK